MRRLASLLAPLALSCLACAAPDEVGSGTANVTEAGDLTVELRTGLTGDLEINLLLDGTRTLDASWLEPEHLEGAFTRIAKSAADPTAYAMDMVDPEELEGIWEGQERGTLSLFVGEHDFPEAIPLELDSLETMGVDDLEQLRGSLLAAGQQGHVALRDLVNLCTLSLTWLNALEYAVDGDGNGSREAKLVNPGVHVTELGTLIPSILERSQVEDAWRVIEEGDRHRITLLDADDGELLGVLVFGTAQYAANVVAQARYMLGEQSGCELQLP